MRYSHHATIVPGLLSLWGSIISLIILFLTFFTLYFLPPTTYIFERAFVVTFFPLGIALAGMFFYWVQWTQFVTSMVRIALFLNIAVFLMSVYLLVTLGVAI